jgi:hypothetical protein
VLPDAEQLARSPRSELERDVVRAYGLLERQRLAGLRTALGRLGVPVRLLERREGAAAPLASDPQAPVAA